MGTLIVGIAHYYSAFEKYKQMAQAAEFKTARIERYLSSQDPSYWATVQGLVKPDDTDILKSAPGPMPDITK